MGVGNPKLDCRAHVAHTLRNHLIPCLSLLRESFNLETLDRTIVSVVYEVDSFYYKEFFYYKITAPVQFTVTYVIIMDCKCLIPF